MTDETVDARANGYGFRGTEYAHITRVINKETFGAGSVAGGGSNDERRQFFDGDFDSGQLIVRRFCVTFDKIFIKNTF